MPGGCGEGMTERLKKAKCRGCCEIEWGYAERVEKTTCRRGSAKKKLRGDIPERVKKTKCEGGGGVCEKKNEGGGYAGERVKKQNAGGGCEIEWGMPRGLRRQHAGGGLAKKN